MKNVFISQFCSELSKKDLRNFQMETLHQNATATFLRIWELKFVCYFYFFIFFVLATDLHRNSPNEKRSWNFRLKMISPFSWEENKGIKCHKMSLKRFIFAYTNITFYLTVQSHYECFRKCNKHPRIENQISLKIISF